MLFQDGTQSFLQSFDARQGTEREAWPRLSTLSAIFPDRGIAIVRGDALDVSGFDLIPFFLFHSLPPG